MNLALITGEFPPRQGGVGDYTRELAGEFARRDIDVRVITQPDPLFAQSGTPSAPPGTGVKVPPLYSVRYADVKSFRSLARVDQLTRDCAVVHIQYQAAAYGMTPPIHFLPRYVRRRLPQRKVYVTFHDLKVPYLFPKAGALRWRAITFLSRSCHAVVVTNQEDLQTLAEAIPGSRSPGLHLIPIGSNIDPAALAPSDRASTRAALGVGAGEILLCYFGFLNASKGGETLVQVLANVIRAGYNARLLMLGGEVGASDPTNVVYAQKVKALIHESGLSERVIWAGFRPAPEVTALWRASDIALLPYADGASLRRGTLMAALAHALPVVSTTPRLAIAQLRDGDNIMLAAPTDANALAARVIALAGSPELRATLSRGAAQLAGEFTWPRIVDQHLHMYH